MRLRAQRPCPNIFLPPVRPLPQTSPIPWKFRDSFTKKDAELYLLTLAPRNDYAVHLCKEHNQFLMIQR